MSRSFHAAAAGPARDGRRVLVTGGCGFIGSHVVDRLLDRGDVVCVLDDLSTGSLANVQGAMDRAGFRLVRGSVMDARLVARLTRASDVVVHLAAAVGVERVLAQPLQSLLLNIHGTSNVLEAASGLPVTVLLASTSEVYGKGHGRPLAEDDDRVMGAVSRLRWSYATSKVVDEIQGLCYWQEHGLRTIAVRLFNVSGPRQSGAYGMVVPRFLEAALTGRPLVVYGDGQQTRCFCHVCDIVEALLALIDCPAAAGGVVNVGSTQEVSINELARAVIAQTGSRSTIRYAVHPGEAHGFEEIRRRMPDLARMRALTGWRPRRDLDAIIRDVARARTGPPPGVGADPTPPSWEPTPLVA